MQTRKPAFQVIDGVPRCVAVEPDFLREGLKFRAKKGDLVQTTFPKSGTHWLLYITHLILREGHPITTYEEFVKEWRFLEYMDIKDFSSSLPLRTFVTHMVLDKRTMTKEGKYVYVARNPWDVCVSFYHMATNMSTFEFQNGTFEDFVDTFVTCAEGHEGDENKYSFVRIGKIGSWKDYFTPDLLRKMENRILEAEKKSSFMDLWKDIRAEAIARMQKAE
ncbi:hypothetical protein MTO96_047107 [Rhipicephalus appendiculatus]